MQQEAGKSLVHFSQHFSERDMKLQALQPAWLNKWRSAAFAEFLEAGLPTRQWEEWKYTNVKKLDAPITQPSEGQVSAELQACIRERIFGDFYAVLVNGRLHSDLSNLPKGPGVEVATLMDYLERKPDAVRSLLQEESKELVQAPFVALNQAYFEHGVVIEVSKNQVLSGTLQVIHVASGQQDVMQALSHRVFVRLDEHAGLDLVEDFISEEGLPSFRNQITTLQLASGARLKYYRLQQEDQATATHIGRVDVQVAKDAHFESFNLNIGSSLCRQDWRISLDGQGAYALLDGLYLIDGKRHVDNHTVVEHRVPHTHSSQYYKGILADQSRGVFNGKVLVKHGANGTAAYQLNKNLLLSQDAEIDTKPELQIDTDDVKCSHGATIGQLNEGELFYLLSRAIPRSQAKVILINAFANDLVLKVSNLLVRKFIQKNLQSYFKGSQIAGEMK